MKFENPIMNISIFEVENVVTTSGEPKANAADEASAALTSAGVTADNTIQVIF